MNPLHRIAAVAGLGMATALLALGGNIAQPKAVQADPPVDASGRTVMVCPQAQDTIVATSSTWGSLDVRGLASDSAQPVPAGKGLLVTGTNEPQVILAEGRQTSAAAGSVFSSELGGADRGLSLARCAHPATVSWFTGLGASAEQRSEVVLTNPDLGPAEVDLRFYGRDGQQTAPGGRGISIPGRSSRTVAVESLFTSEDPVGLEVRTSRGRVASVVRQRAGSGAQPAGSDWQVPAQGLRTSFIIPGVPDGPGLRRLVLTNPGERRADAKIEVLGPDGTFTPLDASSLEVNGHSTASIPLHQGLREEAVAVRVTSDQPLVGSVVATSSQNPAEADLAVQPSADMLTGSALGAIAVAKDVTGAVVVTNTAATDALVSLKLYSATGAELKGVELQVPAGTSRLWEIQQVDQPASVLIRTPKDAQLYAGVVLTSATGQLGLATTPVAVPELTTGGIDPILDPEVG